jgi:hypothetical protein
MLECCWIGARLVGRGLVPNQSSTDNRRGIAMAYTAAGNVERVRYNQAKIVVNMIAALRADVGKLSRLSERRRIQKFDDYKRVRTGYRKLQYLMDNIGERLDGVKGQLPFKADKEIMKNKIESLRAFSKLSWEFFENAPTTVTTALGARDILVEENEYFQTTFEYFDMMRLEAGLDDETSVLLEQTREQIENILKKVEELLNKSPEALSEF